MADRVKGEYLVDALPEEDRAAAEKSLTLLAESLATEAGWRPEMSIVPDERWSRVHLRRVARRKWIAEHIPDPDLYRPLGSVPQWPVVVIVLGGLAVLALIYGA